MRLELRNISDLRPYARNAKHHGMADVQFIAASIERFGFNDPIAVDEDGEIIEGHGRLEAAISLSMEQVPVLVLDGLTERQKRLYRIAHNKIAQGSTFDFAALTDILRTITGETITFEQMGFSEEAARLLLDVVFRPEGAIRNESVVRPDPFTVVWDTEEDKRRWAAFERRVMAVFPQMTKAEALSEFITRCGVLSGIKQSSLFADDGGANDVEFV